HGDNQLGQWLQPGEPGIAGEELEEMVGRLNGTYGGFIGDSFRFNYGLMQGEQALPDGFQPVSKRFGHGLEQDRWSFSGVNAGGVVPSSARISTLLRSAQFRKSSSPS